MYKPMSTKTEKHLRSCVSVRLIENEMRLKKFPNRVNYTPYIFELSVLGDTDVTDVPVISTVSSMTANYTMYREVALMPQLKDQPEAYIAIVYQLFIEALIKRAKNQNRTQLFIMTSDTILLEQLMDFKFNIVVAGRIELTKYKAHLNLGT